LVETIGRFAVNGPCSPKSPCNAIEAAVQSSDPNGIAGHLFVTDEGRIEMLTRFNVTFAVLSGVTASLAFIVPAFAAGQEKPVVVYAGPQEGVRTVRVPYADLNLAERPDQRKLNLRVTGAVQRVCLFEDSRKGLQDRGYYRCADDAWDGANPQIAQAVARAREIALTGHSAIPATAITIRIAGR
jgi:UrcA family protein